MKKKNVHKVREERKEILRLLSLLKEYSKRTGRTFTKRDCYIETYITKYEKGDLTFSRSAFTHCDEQNSAEIERLEAVPSYMANSFKPFVDEFFETEGLNEPYKLEVLNGYKLKLSPHESYNSGQETRNSTGKIPLNKSTSSSTGFVHRNWGQLILEGLNYSYNQIGEIALGAFVKPEDLAKKYAPTKNPHYFLLIICTFSFYFSLQHISQLLGDIFNFYSFIFAKQNNSLALDYIQKQSSNNPAGFSFYKLFAQFLGIAFLALSTKLIGNYLYKSQTNFTPIFNFYLAFSALWTPILTMGMVYLKYSKDAGLIWIPPTFTLIFAIAFFFRNEVYGAAALLDISRKKALFVSLLAMATKIYIFNKITDFSPFLSKSSSLVP